MYSKGLKLLVRILRDKEDLFKYREDKPCLWNDVFGMYDINVLVNEAERERVYVDFDQKTKEKYAILRHAIRRYNNGKVDITDTVIINGIEVPMRIKLLALRTMRVLGIPRTTTMYTKTLMYLMDIHA